MAHYEIVEFIDNYTKFYLKKDASGKQKIKVNLGYILEMGLLHKTFTGEKLR